MMNLGALVVQYLRLHAVAMAVLAFIHPGADRFKDTPAIVDAVASGVLYDASPVWDDETEVAVAIVFADRESRMQLAPRHALDPKTHQPIDGEAHGAWQEHSKSGYGDAPTQFAAWLDLLHDGARTCPRQPAAPLSGRCGGAATRLADHRLLLARAALASMRAVDGELARE